jgi:NitT/TauT family transport system permease protein
MSLKRILAILAGVTALAALVLPFGIASGDGPSLATWNDLPALAWLLVSLAVLGVTRLDPPAWLSLLLAVAGGVVVIWALAGVELGLWGYWLLLASAWFTAWLFAETLANDLASGARPVPLVGAVIPAMFGAAILVSWEAITKGAEVPNVLLPSPSNIWTMILNNLPTLGVDFVQTAKAVLIGYALGNGIAFLVAIAVDRSPFLKRGLLPLGNFVSALPLIGVAPIMVMWFGFDWPSKAAVVVIMTFFPMLVNTVAGLNASGQMERDMMRTYASGYWATLLKLRLPAAAPFIFNALKINSTLALIGAIVAEFFGTPIVGMGFRISSEIGKLNVQMVWAEIAVAALAGSVFYWVVALIERAVTFWHPSVRGGRA